MRDFRPFIPKILPKTARNIEKQTDSLWTIFSTCNHSLFVLSAVDVEIIKKVLAKRLKSIRLIFNEFLSCKGSKKNVTEHVTNL